ncbi:ABC transporter ATP-binding protein [Parvibaculum sp.]|uniref:ABC transporter ATP-binding protein n=1 Tax=Parvibaculum sp. TaxID=2024848 RepID=UPI001B1157F1|nr:ABC transporter ATP-binding protein [Parvibaculum sp.]MBO6668667.1 ABC transporter ATP-binding protein [Parvibaculum sp.]MBO6691225.1 ABC transporter ATP-binding protein [Parvibaculum sp.]MBO6714344.1 ABC transporter ATP-binding protein [Parvibaculum sp.]
MSEAAKNPSAGEPIIRIENVSKIFGGTVKAVDNVNLEVARGEFFALLGPSGCGKTTLLRMLAGFEVPTHGRVIIDGQDMSKVAPNKRPINMVFQSYAVFPHMSVEQNVAYGLKMDRRPAKEIRERVAEALDLVKLGSLGKRMPDEMSGGQRQRVALARALVKRPSVLLLDEPLSALDAKLREAMQLELVRLQKTVGITFVIVTHDQSEALSMANRIAVMNAGTVQQVAPPATLYEAPANRFVADFIGKINMIEGDAVAAGEGEVKVTAPAIGEVKLAGNATGKVALAVRPEKIFVDEKEPTDPKLIKVKGKVGEVAYFGSYSNVFFDIGTGAPLQADISNVSSDIEEFTFKAGEEYWVYWRKADTLVLGD